VPLDAARDLAGGKATTSFGRVKESVKGIPATPAAPYKGAAAREWLVRGTPPARKHLSPLVGTRQFGQKDSLAQYLEAWTAEPAGAVGVRLNLPH